MTLSNNSNKNLVSIDGKSVQRIFYKGISVVTLDLIDELHKKQPGTSLRTFQRYKSKFNEGEDYFSVPHNETLIRTDCPDMSSRERIIDKIKHGERGGDRKNKILLTQMGYLMLSKVFTDDLAWKVQRELVNFYFNKNTNTKQLLQAGTSVTESMALMKEKMKILKMEDELQRLSKKLAHRVLENEVSFETYDSVPMVKMAVSAAMEKDPRFKQMSLF